MVVETLVEIDKCSHMGLHWIEMTTVGIRTLKNRLSEYLRMAQDGHSVAVTNRGMVVARLVPPEAPGETAEETLQRMARAGEIRIGKPHRPELYSPPPGLLSEEQIQEALDWTRGDR